MMSSSANDRPFLSFFRHIPRQESFVQLANLTIQTKNGGRGERPPKPPRMMSSSANYRPFLSFFRHIPPQEGFVKLTV